jgi:hypothetical protein
VRKLVHWPMFMACLAVAAIIAFGASKWFSFSFWLAFGITVVIWIILGLIAFFEDETPGGFNNPRVGRSDKSKE